MAATETVPAIDVWAWTQEERPDLGTLLEAKKAILIHPSLHNRLEARLGEIDEEKDPRTAGLARWMLAQYDRAWRLLRETQARDQATAYARAECCLKGQVGEEGELPTRRPDLAAAILKKHPGLTKDPRVYALYMDALLFDHDIAAAREALEQAPDAVRKGAHGAYVEGRLAEDEGDYRSAKSHYLKAVELDPGHRGALLRLAYQHDLGGDDEEALDYYKRLSGLRPFDVHALLNYGVLLEDHGRNHEAIELYRKVLRAYPNNTRARGYLRDARGSMDMFFDEDIERRHDKRNQLLRIPISDFELSVRARNCLAKMGVETLGDLVSKTESELLAYKNFGETSLSEISVLLESKGLRLGMDLEEEPAPEAPPPKKEPPPADLPPGVDPTILNKVLADLDLSVRCRKALAQLKAVTVGDIIRHSESELLALKNFGQTSLNELKSRLSEFGVSLRQS